MAQRRRADEREPTYPEELDEYCFIVKFPKQRYFVKNMQFNEIRDLNKAEFIEDKRGLHKEDVKKWIDETPNCYYNIDFLPPPRAVSDQTYNTFFGVAQPGSWFRRFYAAYFPSTGEPNWEQTMVDITMDNRINPDEVYSRFKRILKNVVKGDLVATDTDDEAEVETEIEKRVFWYEQWLGDILYNPGLKPGVAILQRGPQASGKSTITHVMHKILGKMAMPFSSVGELKDRHSEAQKGTLFVYKNEMAESDGGKNMDLVESLKNKVDQQQTTINEKFAPQRTFSCFERYFMTTNSNAPLHLSKEGSRKFTVFEAGTDIGVGDFSWWSEAYSYFDNDKHLGVLAFLLYLARHMHRHYDLRVNKPATQTQTELQHDDSYMTTFMQRYLKDLVNNQPSNPISDAHGVYASVTKRVSQVKEEYKNFLINQNKLDAFDGRRAKNFIRNTAKNNDGIRCCRDGNTYYLRIWPVPAYHGFCEQHSLDK
jgi:hypothetical protein